MVHFNVMPALQVGGILKDVKWFPESWFAPETTGLIVKLCLPFFLFLHLSLWMTARQVLAGPFAWFGSLVCKLKFIAHFSKGSLQEPPSIKPGAVMPLLQWGRGRWLKHLYLVPTLLSAETPRQLWTSKEESLAGHWPHPVGCYENCVSPIASHWAE